ncbi:hypothetical protein R6Q59_007028 [Mikania micrantha]
MLGVIHEKSNQEMAPHLNISKLGSLLKRGMLLLNRTPTAPPKGSLAFASPMLSQKVLVSLDMGSLLAGAKFGGVKCSYGRVDIMRSLRARSYGSEMFIND